MEKNFKKGEIVIYKSKEGPKLEVRLEENTVFDAKTNCHTFLIFKDQP